METDTKIVALTDLANLRMAALEWLKQNAGHLNAPDVREAIKNTDENPEKDHCEELSVDELIERYPNGWCAFCKQPRGSPHLETCVQHGGHGCDEHCTKPPGRRAASPSASTDHIKGILSPGTLLIQANVALIGDRSLNLDDWAFAISFIERIGLWLNTNPEMKDDPQVILCANACRKNVYGYLWPTYQKFVGNE